MLEELAWPIDSLAEAFEALAVETNLPLERDPLPELPDLMAAKQRGDLRNLDELIERWMQAAGRARGFDVEGTSTAFADLLQFFQRAGPCVSLVLGTEEIYLLVIVGPQGKKIRLLLPSGQSALVDPVLLYDQVSSQWLRIMHNRANFLQSIGLAYKTQESLRRAFLTSLLNTQQMALGWMLHRPVSAPLGRQLAGAKLRGPLALLCISALSSTLLSLIAWYMVGSDALTGRVDRGRLIAWSLVLLMTVALGGISTYAQGETTLRVSLVLKRVLLQGFVKLSPDKVRAEGLGRQLSLVGESAVLEEFAIGGAFALLASVIQLASAAYLFWLTPPARHLIPLLLLWVVFCLIATGAVYRRRDRWTDLRLGLTNDLIAKMSGHRTRRIQQTPTHWHDGEDELLADYWQASRSLDNDSVLMMLLPRAWLVVGAFALVPVVLAPITTLLLAAMVGLLLSYQSLQTFLNALQPFIRLGIALKVLKEPLRAAQVVDKRPVSFVLPSTQQGQHGPLVELYEVVFRFRDQGPPVLRGCNLTITRGQRLLLEGSSGGGKSTLTALIAGLRAPESGLILVADHDHHSLNHEAWRRIVATSPQFHENHIFSNTISFNLLMGRTWPPSSEDILEAQAVCEELGLGPLLARMPNGMSQLVGETGWQLSHGEKSRIFIARALLQGAELLILDESFGALDPETLELCMAAVLRHTKTLLVVAHP